MNSSKKPKTMQMLNEKEHFVNLIEAKIERAEVFCNALEKEALFHLSDICPDKCKRLLGDSADKDLVSNMKLEQVLEHQDLYRSFAGCELIHDECQVSFEQNDFGELLRITKMNGKVREIFFSIVVEYNMNAETANDTIVELKFSPESNFLNDLGMSLMTDSFLPSLFVPLLQKYQDLKDEMLHYFNTLDAIPAVETLLEDDLCHITFTIQSTLQISIVWRFEFDLDDLTVANFISVKCSKEDLISLSQHKLYPILAGKEPLLDGDSIHKFVQSFEIKD